MSQQKKLDIIEHQPLAPLTTLKVGGAARFFVNAKTTEEVVAAIDFAGRNELPIFILGGGSNVLISDRGFDGLVLQIALQGIAIKENLVTAQAGEDWDNFVKICVEKNLQGVECLSGIPGFTGGTPVQNVGAYGQEVSETIESVKVFDRKSKEILDLTNKDCKFAYRISIFNTAEKNRFVVLAVSFRLNLDSAPKIVYKDLKEFFGEKTPSLNEAREAVLQIRRAKSMVIDEADENSKSAGSFFKNPIVANNFYENLKAETNLEIPQFKVDEKFVKIPAAWLIEQSGFHKGFTKGNAGISTKHSLALINRGNATATDILSLKTDIQEKVKEKFDIDLQPEPIFVGFES